MTCNTSVRTWSTDIQNPSKSLTGRRLPIIPALRRMLRQEECKGSGFAEEWHPRFKQYVNAEGVLFCRNPACWGLPLPRQRHPSELAGLKCDLKHIREFQGR